MRYTNSMKATVIKRMTGRNPVSAASVAQETGISQATLSRWRRQAATVGTVGPGTRTPNKQASPSPPKRARGRTSHDKLALVAQAASLADEELGAFIRREGLHAAQLAAWTELAANALEHDGASTKRARRGPTPEQTRIRELERELRRKEKALAEAAALLVLKKKFATVFEDEEPFTDPRSDR